MISDFEFFSDNAVSIDYRLFEWRLILNRELYENNLISFDVFCYMDNSLINRMNHIKEQSVFERSI